MGRQFCWRSWGERFWKNLPCHSRLQPKSCGGLRVWDAFLAVSKAFIQMGRLWWGSSMHTGELAAASWVASGLCSRGSVTSLQCTPSDSGTRGHGAGWGWCQEVGR